MYVDAHIHILDTLENVIPNSLESKEDEVASLFNDDIFFCASSNEAERFIIQQDLCSKYSSSFILSFGIHPQAPSFDGLDFLQELLETKKINAIGECGFDFFTSEYKKTEEIQKTVWAEQLRLAQKYGLPIIVHCRKGLPLIFADTMKLKKLPSVIFHGWSGSNAEASAFLKRGVNAYFCIGKGLLRGQKAQLETCAKQELSHLLIETDAPYMCLKGEPYSIPNDIKTVFLAAYKIRYKNRNDFFNSVSSEDTINIEEFKLQLLSNFKQAFLS